MLASRYVRMPCTASKRPTPTLQLSSSCRCAQQLSSGSGAPTPRKARSSSTYRPLSTSHGSAFTAASPLPPRCLSPTSTALVQARPASSMSTSSPDPPTTTDGLVDNSADLLDWNRFFKLRKVRRRYNLVASLGTSVGTTALGISILSQQDLDAMGGQIFGLEPVVVLGLVTAGFGALGWLAGPFLGNAAFNVVNSKFRDQIVMKEREFFSRIKRFRVDPSSQSFSNPVPDYYGEKIGSVADYRQWLKDQRAYNKKRQSFV
ncbi:MAG: TIM23 complex component [Thelocarpon superellum]|nr:MAG: TIM23 complex component [Thelocarpon superellum]